MRKRFSILSEVLLDALFPRRCLGCRAFDTWLCADCHKNLALLTEQKCPICTIAITREGATCFACAQKPSTFLDGIFVASTYRDPLLKRLTHFYKYRFIAELSQPLALLLAQALQNSHLRAPDIIMPVPLHKRRERWRGFNQSHRLAQDLDLTVPFSHENLRRVRYTTAQVAMRSRSGRLANIKDAFVVTEPHLLKGKNILLIDDISTTSATLNECARTLKKSGARIVTGLVLAKE